MGASLKFHVVSDLLEEKLMGAALGRRVLQGTGPEKSCPLILEEVIVNLCGLPVPKQIRIKQERAEIF